MANSNSIQTNCRFKIAEPREKIFKLSQNTGAVYSVGTINMNEVCPASNDITAMQIQSGDTIKVKPGCYVRTMDHVISADESDKALFHCLSHAQVQHCVHIEIKY
jgi:hypothetical protein